MSTYHRSIPDLDGVVVRRGRDVFAVAGPREVRDALVHGAGTTQHTISEVPKQTKKKRHETHRNILEAEVKSPPPHIDHKYEQTTSDGSRVRSGQGV